MEKEIITTKTVVNENQQTKVELKFGKKFITKSLRGQNYDLETALSELVDNSIDAESDNIEITYPSKVERKNSELIIIKDDGKGMSKDELINAMTLGSDRDYDETDIGYFGIGMKASLAYLSENVIIKTKKKQDNFYTQLIWNIDIDTSFTIQEIELDSVESGTTIIINPGHRYDYYSHSQESVVIKKFGGRYFHLLCPDADVDKYKKQVKIKINNTIVLPVDPMYRDNIISGKTIYSPQEDIIWKDTFGDDFPIKICGYYLKNYQYEPNSFDIKAGRSGLSLDRSGIYVLLSNKYINLGGTYLGVLKLDPHTTYLRIEMSIPKNSTEYFGISMNKNSISDFLSDERHIDSVKEKIRKSITELSAWGRNQEELFKKKQAVTDPEQIKETEKIVNQLNNEFKSKGITKNPLNNPEISEKVIAQKPKNEDKDDPKGSKDRPDNLHYDKNLLDINLYNGGETGEFWDITRQNTKLIIRLNSDHIFYREFISSSTEQEKKKMIKLLFSLAWAQLESLGLYYFDGQINDLWNDFWSSTSKALKRTLS